MCVQTVQYHDGNEKQTSLKIANLQLAGILIEFY